MLIFSIKPSSDNIRNSDYLICIAYNRDNNVPINSGVVGHAIVAINAEVADVIDSFMISILRSYPSAIVETLVETKKEENELLQLYRGDEPLARIRCLSDALKARFLLTGQLWDISHNIRDPKVFVYNVVFHDCATMLSRYIGALRTSYERKPMCIIVEMPRQFIEVRSAAILIDKK